MDVPVYGLDRVCSKRLVSFQDGHGFSLGIGVIRSVLPGALEILTPFHRIDRAAGLRVGTLRFDPETGKELP